MRIAGPILTFILLFWAATAPAQVSLSPLAPAEEAPAEGAAAPEAPSTQALIELLRDDAARQALIEQLEAGIAETGADPAAEEDTVPIAEPVLSFGRQIAEITQKGAESVAATLDDLVRQIRNFPTTLRGLRDATDPQVLWDTLWDLSFVIAATYLSFVLLRLLSRRISRRLARRATQKSWFAAAMLSIFSSVVDIAVVALAWAAGYALTLMFYQSFGVIQIRQSLYLNAFLSVELAKVAGRAILAPHFGDLRLISLTDTAARAIWRWLNVTISVLGYGLLLAVPVVNFAAGYYAGAALSMVLSAGVIIYTMIRVLQARDRVAAWIHTDAPQRPEEPAGADPTPITSEATAAPAADRDTPPEEERTPSILTRLARLWYLPVLAYLLVLLVLVVARPGNVLLPLLRSSGLVVATLLGGLMLSNLLGRSGRTGVQLPEYVSNRLPLLDRRINRMLPRLLLFARLLLAALVLAIALDIVGVWDIGSWLRSPTGTAFLASAAAVLVISGIAFLIWLAMASWVDFRLNPLFGTVPTPREITLLSLLRNAATILILILTLMFVLSHIGLDIAPLLASAGVLGLAIGFGAQKMVQDIITGVFIQFENAINVGDVVGLGGVTGVVEKLTVRSVSLRDLNGVFHIIPFSSVDMVSNYMREFSFHLADIGVAYREDSAVVKQAMLDAYDELREDAELAPDLIGDIEWFGLNSFDDSAITMRARIKTMPGKQWGIGRAYNLIIKRIFDERGIEIPFPHQTLYFGEDRDGNAPPLRLRQVGQPAPDSPPPAAEPPHTPVRHDPMPEGDED